MKFEYCCEKHGVFEEQYGIGRAPTKVPCPSCQVVCPRYYGNVSFILKGGGWPSKKQSFNQEMTKRNEQAGRKMRKTWEGTQPKLVE